MSMLAKPQEPAQLPQSDFPTMEESEGWQCKRGKGKASKLAMPRVMKSKWSVATIKTHNMFLGIGDIDDDEQGRGHKSRPDGAYSINDDAGDVSDDGHRPVECRAGGD